MTTITDAHRAEARRRLGSDRLMVEGRDAVEILAQALAEDAWQPPLDPEAAVDVAWLKAARLAEKHEDPRLNIALADLCTAIAAIKRSKSNG